MTDTQFALVRHPIAPFDVLVLRTNHNPASASHWRTLSGLDLLNADVSNVRHMKLVPVEQQGASAS